MPADTRNNNQRVTLAIVQHDIRTGFEAVNRRLDRMEAVQQVAAEQEARRETRLTVVERFCDEQVKPAIKQVTENRLELAKLAAVAFGGGFGGGGLLVIIAKALGI